MRVLAAMSGGVDSAVAAARAVDAGHEVVGVHMALSRNRNQFRTGSRGCCSIEDAGDARRAADILGIPYYVWDLSEKFEDTVVADFLSEYAAGRTPNPCVRCNEHIKFEALLDKATALGFDAVATGHYAQVVTRETADGTQVRELHRSPNTAKDQSYVLAVMGPQRLARAMFPLGAFTTKDEVRAEAAARGLSVSTKPDSYDICFVADGDTQGFLRDHLGAKPGDIVDTDGRVVGAHDGAYSYTVGQRKGLSIGRPAPDGKPRYVLDVQPVSNRVVVGPAEMLTVDRIAGDQSVWLADDVLAAAGLGSAVTSAAVPRASSAPTSGPTSAPTSPTPPVPPAGPPAAPGAPVPATGWFDAEVQVRAHGEPVPARVRAVADATGPTARMEVELTGETLRGVAAGQSLVAYAGTRVLGQATVVRAWRARPHEAGSWGADVAHVPAGSGSGPAGSAPADVDQPA